MTIEIPKNIIDQLEIVSVIVGFVVIAIVLQNSRKDMDVVEEFNTSILPNADVQIFFNGEASYHFSDPEKTKEVAYLFYKRGYDVSILDESDDWDLGPILVLYVRLKSND